MGESKSLPGLTDVDKRRAGKPGDVAALVGPPSGLPDRKMAGTPGSGPSSPHLGIGSGGASPAGVGSSRHAVRDGGRDRSGGVDRGARDPRRG